MESDMKKICEGAYAWLKIGMTHVNPFPVRGKNTGSLEAQIDEFDGMVLDAFTNAAFDLELDEVEPTEEVKRLVHGLSLSSSVRR
jgi:hypothetical protein